MLPKDKFKGTDALTASLYLGGATPPSLIYACRLLADHLSSKLKERKLVWQHLTLFLDLEDKSLSLVREFARTQSPESLSFHLEKLLQDNLPASPVEKISVALGWLRPAPISQLTLFGGQDPEKIYRLKEALEAVSFVYRGSLTPASNLLPSRRELMLTFYDPLRSTSSHA